jgi:serine protease Do
MLREGSDVDLSDEYQTIDDAFDHQLTSLTSTNAVLEVMHKEALRALATVVSDTGLLVTKASALGSTNELSEITIKGHSIRMVEIDEKRDLALIYSEAADEIAPIKFAKTEPRSGQLLLSPTPSNLRRGVLTQPPRHAPRPGFDHLVTTESTPPWLGIVLDPDAVPPMIIRVDPGSPAAAVGLLEGDILTEVAGEALEKGTEDLLERLGKRQPGERFSLTIERAGETRKLRPILGSRRSFSNKTSMQAVRVDQALSGLSARGGKLSDRRQGFPLCYYHDMRLKPTDCGGPLIDLGGRVVGINISRSLRHRSLAIPATDVLRFIRSYITPDPESE